jgi:hypothetical protein
MEGAGCLPSQSRHRIRQFQSRKRLLLVCLRSGYRAVVVSILCSMTLRVPSPPLLDIKEGKAEGMLNGGRDRNEEIGHASLLPLPKPLTTLPPMRSGNGGSGPESGPIICGLPSLILSICLSNSLLDLLQFSIQSRV